MKKIKQIHIFLAGDVSGIKTIERVRFLAEKKKNKVLTSFWEKKGGKKHAFVGSGSQRERFILVIVPRKNLIPDPIQFSYRGKIFKGVWRKTIIGPIRSAQMGKKPLFNQRDRSFPR